MFEFQELTVYKKSKQFHIHCKTLLVHIKPEKFVTDQLGRASFSVVLNIAEGLGKVSSADRKSYFTVARASVFECVAILDILMEEGKLSEENHLIHLKLADELSRMMFAMIKNLSSK